MDAKVKPLFEVCVVLQQSFIPACIDEQQGWIVVRHHRGGRHKIVHLSLEELDKAVSDFLRNSTKDQGVQA